jgi:hypothetical protein
MSATLPDEIRLPLNVTDPTSLRNAIMDIQRYLNIFKGMGTYEWNGTQIRIKNPDGTWGVWVDLVGPDGPDGPDGPAGANGEAGADGSAGTSITTVISSSAPNNSDGNPNGTIHFETV